MTSFINKAANKNNNSIISVYVHQVNKFMLASNTQPKKIALSVSLFSYQIYICAHLRSSVIIFFTLYTKDFWKYFYVHMIVYEQVYLTQE